MIRSAIRDRFGLGFAALALGAAASLLGLSCDTSVHPGGDAGPSASCVEARDRSDLAWIEDNVFRTSCALSASCHTGPRPAATLTLAPTRSHAQLVGVPAASAAGWVRVAPGSPEESYILVKLGVVPGPLGDAGTLMPPNSPPICAEKIEAVTRWIAQGAPGRGVDAGAPDAGVAGEDAGAEDAASELAKVD